MAKSAKLAQKKLEALESTARPNASLSGTVNKLVPSLIPGQPEQAQITMDGVDPLYRDLRIENKLTNAQGDDVKLKKGARVDVIISGTGSANGNDKS